MKRKPHLLYLVTEDWYFCSHRLPLAIAAREAGYRVTLVTRVSTCATRIRAAGIELIPLRLSRSSHNPLREIATIVEIIGIYRRLRPDIVHHVALKPVLYGGLAARLLRVPAVVNALMGLGYIFSSGDLKARLLRPLVEIAYRGLLNARNSHLIVQNPDDRDLLTGRRLVAPNRIVLIRGSGVDLLAFDEVPEPAGVPLVILPARMLRDKGVEEFVVAARLLKQQGVSARFALVGDPDPDNPASIPEATLKGWQAQGAVEYWGWRNDMTQVYRECNLVVLPAYREGLPKALIEAAACARAIITCDVPGCREVVRHEDNGLLVPVQDPIALMDAMRRLIREPSTRHRMGARGRARAEEKFSIEKVVQETLNVYQELISSA
jgi:glycosyltransferase involved in cell wall biosynthesis